MRRGSRVAGTGGVLVVDFGARPRAPVLGAARARRPHAREMHVGPLVIARGGLDGDLTALHGDLPQRPPHDLDHSFLSHLASSLEAIGRLDVELDGRPSKLAGTEYDYEHDECGSQHNKARCQR